MQLVQDFRRRSDLVVAALAALDALPRQLAALTALLGAPAPITFDGALLSLYGLVYGATVEAGNLLVADLEAIDTPVVLRAVARQPSGAIVVRSIELDPDAFALTGPSQAGTRALDRLAAELQTLESDGAIAAVRSAIADLATQITNSVSRLSLVKARLDLQESFLTSVLDADASSPCVSLESHLNQAGARDLAIAAQRMLRAHSLTIAKGNRKTLAALLERHASDVG